VYKNKFKKGKINEKISFGSMITPDKLGSNRMTVSYLEGDFEKKNLLAKERSYQ
jgi:hypothetical protein